MPEVSKDSVKQEEKKLDEKLRRRLTPHELKLVKEKIKAREKISRFGSEFRKQLLTFVTGAFTFMAALMWRDAIKLYFDSYDEAIAAIVPVKEAWFVQMTNAFVMTIIAVAAILFLTRILKVE